MAAQHLFRSFVAILTLMLVGGCPTGQPAEKPGELTTRATVDAETVEYGALVALNAEVEVPEGETVSYLWTQTAGVGVVLQDPRSATATFTAPSVEATQVLSFHVAVTSTQNAVGQARVSVVVAADPEHDSRPQNGGNVDPSIPPFARAGADFDVVEDETGTLDGSGSTGYQLQYRWRRVSGPAVTLLGSDRAIATFIAPKFSISADKLEFELMVTDAQERSAVDRVVATLLQGEGGGDTEQQETARVRVRTSLGDFEIALDGTNAPRTVENFLMYVDEGFYAGTIFHRVIPDFVVQGGGFEPGMIEKETHDPVRNEATNGLKNDRGTVAMARTNDPDSATSQFFVNLVDNDSLNATANRAGYTVFGEVVSGMEVVDAIGAVATTTVAGFQDVPVADVLIIEIVRIDDSENVVP